MKTSAMIFAAGLGTRLYPLTANKPKALVEYQGKPLLEHAITKILEAGIQHIVINVHHFGEQIIEYINQHHYNADIEISDERAQLLETAGGLKFAEHFFTNTSQILLYNVDVISSIDLGRFVQDNEMIRRLDDKMIQISNPKSQISNLKSPLATLCVRHRESSRYFLFEEPELRLCGWENIKTNERKVCYEAENTVPLAFSGIHLVDKKILDLIPKNEKISFTPLYLNLAKDYLIQGYLHDEDTWEDVGRIKN
jgi:NDP-sugar pyrophosphorylase family protein